MTIRQCKKKKFSTDKLANQTLDYINQHSVSKVKPIRSYLCYCGSWHLTSRVDIKVLVEENTNLKAENTELQNKLAVAEIHLRVLKDTKRSLLSKLYGKLVKQK
jgi:hypothetical protein